MNKKNVLKLFKKAVDKNCVLNTKLRERKILYIMGEEHEVDSDLLYKVAMIGYTAQEKDGTLNELFNGYYLESLRDYPIELNRWGFFRDWYFSWVSNTSKKPSHNSFEFTAAALGEKDKIACVIKVPVIWYMLAVYPNVDVDMLEEMEPEHFEMLRLNKNLSDSVKLLIKNK
jgi:hypothetical protein